MRSEFAITALRTLMLSNGGSVVLNATYRLAPLTVTASWSGYLVAASFRPSAGGEKSPFTWSLPVRIFVEADTVSLKPSWKSILSTYAGRQSVFGSQFGFRSRVMSLPGW